MAIEWFITATPDPADFLGATSYAFRCVDRERNKRLDVYGLGNVPLSWRPLPHEGGIAASPPTFVLPEVVAQPLFELIAANYPAAKLSSTPLDMSDVVTESEALSSALTDNVQLRSELKDEQRRVDMLLEIIQELVKRGSE